MVIKKKEEDKISEDFHSHILPSGKMVRHPNRNLREMREKRVMEMKKLLDKIPDDEI